MKPRQIRVVDIPADATAEDAERLFNEPCEIGYRLDKLIFDWPGVGARAFFQLRADVDGGIHVAEFQAKMPEICAPPEGETRQARCEAAIRKVMRSRRKVTLRELRRRANSSRYGLGMWDNAMKALVHAGDVRIAEGERINSKICILLKQQD
jgi:hypothetical protein